MVSWGLYSPFDYIKFYCIDLNEFVQLSVTYPPRTHEECDDGYKPLRHEPIPISIHALTRSATLGLGDPLTHMDDFNPRTHEECDLVCSRRSMHLLYFNPRTHEECDSVSALASCRRTIRFQSTHSRGVRRRIIAIINEFMYKSTD